MPHDMQKIDSETKQPVSLGIRLRTAREELGLERKDVASQLRLNEKIILMMEKERFPADLPITFIRGYIRSYGKFLQIPEFEIKKAMERIKPKAIPTSHAPTLKPYKIQNDNSESSLTKLLTALVLITLLGIGGIWYYSRNLPFSQSNTGGESTMANVMSTLGIRTSDEASKEAAQLDTKSDLAKPATASQNTATNTKNSAPAYPTPAKSDDKNQITRESEKLTADAEEVEISGLYPD